MATQQYHVNEQGERIIPASRRPDGTVRKERKVKPGYIPQDEQQTYVPRQAQVFRSGPRVPGMDNAELDAVKAAAKSKSAKKNEKRKAKKETSSDSVAAITSSLASAGLSNGEAQLPTSTSATPPPTPPSTAQPNGVNGGQSSSSVGLLAAEKLLRALQKKIRQAEVLRERAESGDTLTTPEREKLAKLASWKQETKELEAEAARCKH